MKENFFDVCILIIMTLLIFAGCNKGGGNEAAVKSPSRDPLDQEAIGILKPLLDRHIIKCGDLTYMSPGYNKPFNTYARSLKGGDYQLNKHDLSEADKMNGIEWSGGLLFGLHSPCQMATDYQSYDQWQSFCPNGIGAGAIKKGGRWQLDDATAGDNPHPLTCEEVANPTARKGP